MYYTYILRCADNTLYTGFTTDLERRLAVHNAGKGAKYTRGRLPVVLVWSAMHETEGKARSQEYNIKCLGREKKEKLIKNVQLLRD